MTYCDYKFNFFRNMVVLVSVFLFIFTSWVFIYFIERSFRSIFVKCFKSKAKKEVYVMNLLVRFLNLIFFEIVLACLINFVLLKSGARGQIEGILLSVVFFAISMLFYVFVIAKGCGKKSPFKMGVYQDRYQLKHFFNFEHRKFKDGIVDAYVGKYEGSHLSSMESFRYSDDVSESLDDGMSANIELKLRTDEKRVSLFNNKILPVDEGFEVESGSLGVGENGSTDSKPNLDTKSEKD